MKPVVVRNVRASISALKLLADDMDTKLRNGQLKEAEEIASMVYEKAGYISGQINILIDQAETSS